MNFSNEINSINIKSEVSNSKIAYLPIQRKNLLSRRFEISLAEISDTILDVSEDLLVEPVTVYIFAYQLALSVFLQDRQLEEMVFYSEIKNAFIIKNGLLEQTVKEAIYSIQEQLFINQDHYSCTMINNRWIPAICFVNQNLSNKHWLCCEINVDKKICTFTYADWIESCDDFFVSSLANHYKIILIQIKSLINKKICNLNIITNHDKNLLDYFNSTVRQMDDTFAIWDKIDMFSIKFPKKNALICGNTKINYFTLSKEIRKTEEDFIEFGISKGDIVCICMESLVDAIVAIIAVMRLGAAFMPLDPGAPHIRLSNIIQNVKANYICYDKTKKVNIPYIDTKSCSSMVDRIIWNQSKSTPKNGQTIAYIMCTSGSTGDPKCIPIYMTSFINTLLSFQKLLSFTETDCMLSTTALTFDIVLLEIFLPLISGACCVLAQDELHKSIYKVINLLESNEITFMQATPAVWRTLIHYGLSKCSSLSILCGGESLDSMLCNELLERSKNVWNVYGPTEATIWCTAFKVVPFERNIIGRPIYNTKVYIVDKFNKLLPVGVFGELCVSGVGVTPGYIGSHAECNKASFINIPELGQLFYKTGDIARWLPDGNLEFHTRTNNFAKVNSRRISLEEIEYCLRKHVYVKDAGVVVIQRDSMREYLVAYVVTDKKVFLDGSQLQNFLSLELPTYMIPNHYISINSIPLNSNMKVDRRKLVEIYEKSTLSEEVENYTNCRLYRLILEVLKDNGVPIKYSCNEKLLNQALDSITIIGILGGLAEKGIKINYSDFCECKTISDLLNRVFVDSNSNVVAENSRSNLSSSKLYKLLCQIEKDWGRKVNVKMCVPLTSTQQNMLCHTLLYHDNMFYCTNQIWIEGEVDTNIIQQAFKILVKEIDCFRTIYILNADRGTLQLVLNDTNCKFVYIDGTKKCGFNIDNIIRQINKRVLSTILNVPIEVVFIRTNGEKYCLIFHYHHIVMDGISFDIIIKQFFEIYRNLLLSKNVTYKIKNTFCDYFENTNWRSHIKWRNEVVAISNNFHKIYKKGELLDTNILYRDKFLSEKTLSKCVSVSEILHVSLNTFLQAHIALALMNIYAMSFFRYEIAVSGRPVEFYNSPGMFMLSVPVFVNKQECSTTELIIQMNKQISMIQDADISIIKNYESIDSLENMSMPIDLLIVFERKKTIIKDINKSILPFCNCQLYEYKCDEITEKEMCIYINCESSITFHYVCRNSIFDKNYIDQLHGMIARQIDEITEQVMGE